MFVEEFHRVRVYVDTWESWMSRVIRPKWRFAKKSCHFALSGLTSVVGLFYALKTQDREGLRSFSGIKIKIGVRVWVRLFESSSQGLGLLCIRNF